MPPARLTILSARRGTLLPVTDPVDEVPPINGPGEWAAHGRCAQLDLVTAEVFVADRPDPDELVVAARICDRCLVLDACAGYAVQVGAYAGCGAGAGTTGAGRSAT